MDLNCCFILLFFRILHFLPFARQIYKKNKIVPSKKMGIQRLVQYQFLVIFDFFKGVALTCVLQPYRLRNVVRQHPGYQGCQPWRAAAERRRCEVNGALQRCCNIVIIAVLRRHYGDVVLQPVGLLSAVAKMSQCDMSQAVRSAGKNQGCTQFMYPIACIVRQI